MKVLLALILLGAAGAVIFYLFRLLGRALEMPLAGWLNRWLLDRAVAQAQRGDRHMKDGSVTQAAAAYESAIYGRLADTHDLARAVGSHHTGLLSRLIVAADERNRGHVRLLSLAKLDRLLQERAALQRTYLAALQAKRRQQMAELRRDFEVNTREVKTTLTQLVSEVSAPIERERYH